MRGNGTLVKSSTETLPADKALADSLRAFLKTELNGGQAPGREQKHNLRAMQVVFLIAFALDITFLYFHLVGSEENKVLELLYKVLPALGVTLAIPYLERLRASLLQLSCNPWFGTPLLAIAIVLLAMQASIYSVFLQVDSASTDVELGLDDGTKLAMKKVELDKQNRVFFPVPKLQSYRVTLRDQDGGSNPEVSYQIHWGEVLKGTLAQLPSFDEIFKPRLLVAAYEVNLIYSDQHGNLYISADPGFVLNQPVPSHSSAPAPNYSNVRLHPLTAADPKGDCASADGCWHKQINSGDAFALPRGKYVFTQDTGDGKGADHRDCVVWEEVQIKSAQQVTLEPGAQRVQSRGCE